MYLLFRWIHNKISDKIVYYVLLRTKNSYLYYLILFISYSIKFYINYLCSSDIEGCKLNPGSWREDFCNYYLKTKKKTQGINLVNCFLKIKEGDFVDYP